MPEDLQSAIVRFSFNRKKWKKIEKFGGSKYGCGPMLTPHGVAAGRQIGDLGRCPKISNVPL